MRNKLNITGVFCLNFLAIFSQQKINLQPTEALMPTSYSQMNLAPNYTNPNGGTTDLFGKNSVADFSIPSNYMGTQDAVEGENYFGIIVHKGDNVVDWQATGKGGLAEGKPEESKYSEYIQVALPQALISGKTYEVNLKMSLADNSGYAAKGFGVYFSDVQLMENDNNMLKVTPQVNFPNLVTDKNTWTEIKGNFTATGSEKFLTFGCFKSTFAVEPVKGAKDLGTYRAYYYVSSIAIVEASMADTDNDGVPDKDDKCPKLAGIKDNFGCPEIILRYKHDDITFNAEDKADLEKVINFLKRNPDVNITISSHTSTSGEPEYNQTLSEKRANNTKDYLISNGIDAKRLTVKGYGEQFPIGDNNTEEGKTQSRRTVITITK